MFTSIADDQLQLWYHCLFRIHLSTVFVGFDQDDWQADLYKNTQVTQHQFQS